MLGLDLIEPFFTTLIFMGELLGCAGVMRQRNQRRFEARLVTRRRVHVPKLGVRCNGTSAGAHRNERTISALLPGGERLEFIGRSLPPAILTAVDVAGRQRRLARETGARVKRPVRPDRMGVTTVDLAGAHVDAVDSFESVA